jgi:hypothetical protein
MKLFSVLLALMTLSIGVASAQSDEAAIKKVIEEETRAWHAGDLKAQMACWQIQPYSRALISTMNGMHFDLSADMMKNRDPLTPTGASASNSNYLIQLNGNTAWSSHDQTTTAKDDTKGFSHEMRMLEKSGSTWKIVGMSVHQYKSK